MDNLQTGTEDTVSRRTLLGLAGAAGFSLAGCVGSSSDDDGNDSAAAADAGQVQPAVEDPPDRVYKPSHSDAVVMLPTITAGPYELLPHFTFQHKFWLMRGAETEAVEPTDGGVHLMIAFWDGETGKLLPADVSPELTISRDGETVHRTAPWSMLSQAMGFHFGDNVPLPEDGTYTVDVSMSAIDEGTVRKTGDFAGRFTSAESASFEFEYSTDLLDDLRQAVQYVPRSQRGEPGAVEMPTMLDQDGEPMEMGGDGMDGDMGGNESAGGMNAGGMSGNESAGDMDGGGMGMRPSSSLEPPSAYPGRDLGSPSSDDATILVRYLENSRLADGGGYLLVSPRTPYRRYPLPNMALSASGAVEGSLQQTVDNQVGHHYGLAADLAAGDTVDIAVESAPQIARHAGYETAFIDMSPVTVTVPQ